MVDEEKLTVYAGFLRVMRGASLSVDARQAPAVPQTQGTPDEAAALGRLEPLERGVGCLRAYCTHLLVSQDMSQLRELYRPSGSCLANGTWTCRCRVRGGEIRFEIIGQATSLAKNQGTSRSNMDMMRQQHSTGLSETGHWLLTLSEVLRLPGRRA
nr:type IV secretory system conjugative DNA transfer family protein [Bradyrhizobium sp. CCBAU 11434]